MFVLFQVIPEQDELGVPGEAQQTLGSVQPTQSGPDSHQQLEPEQMQESVTEQE
jgi:hypothetical protein